jgi:hypothetical protein
VKSTRKAFDKSKYFKKKTSIKKNMSIFKSSNYFNNDFSAKKDNLGLTGETIHQTTELFKSCERDDLYADPKRNSKKVSK